MELLKYLSYTKNVKGKCNDEHKEDIFIMPLNVKVKFKDNFNIHEIVICILFPSYFLI